MSRVVLFHGVGQPLETQEREVPRPARREMLVRVACCTLCRSDLHTHAGRRGGPTPIVLGHEIVGHIEAFGQDTPRVDAAGQTLEIGDRVSWSVAASCGNCFFCADDLPQKCERLFKYGHERATPEHSHTGGLADHVVLVSGTTWLRIPDVISDAIAAPANCATATVAAVLRAGGPVAGKNVLVLGVGMLGVTACALARSLGAREVVASDPSAECLQRAATFGAGRLAPVDPAARSAIVADATQGRGADVVLELAGTRESVEAALTLARIGGIIVMAGTVAPVGTVAFDPEAAVRRQLVLRGMHNYHPRDLQTALDFLAGAGKGYPFESLVGTTFALAQVEQAFAHAHANPGRRVAVVP